MSINKTAGSLAKQITDKLPPGKVHEEVLAYGLQLIFLGAIGLFAVSLGGFLLGAGAETLAALIAASLLRTPGGGIHLSTPFKCLLFTAAIFISIGYCGHLAGSYPATVEYLLFIILISGTISILTGAKLAPVTSPNKPINSPVLREKLHILAVAAALLVTVMLLLIYPKWPAVAFAGAAGLTWQSINIILAYIIYREKA